MESGDAGAGVSATAPSFSLFRLLPAELRRKIWNTAIEMPRIIHVGSRDNIDTSNCVMFKSNICTQASTVFFVNYESRAVAFQYPWIKFSMIPDPDDSDEIHFLISPHDIVSLGAMCPLKWHSDSTIFSCRGDAHLVQNLMMCWGLRELEDLEFFTLYGNIRPIVWLARHCVQAFGNRDSLRNMYCLVQGDDGVITDRSQLPKDPQDLTQFDPGRSDPNLFYELLFLISSPFPSTKHDPLCQNQYKKCPDISKAASCFRLIQPRVLEG